MNALLQPLYGWLPVEQGTALSLNVLVPVALLLLANAVVALAMVTWARWPRGKP